jgi:hypothetical protein
MEQQSIRDLSTPRADSFEPPQSEHPIHVFSYEFSPSLINLVRETCSFWGSIIENPYVHLQEFEMVCSCYAIAGLTPETFRWKLFPFSRTDKGKQWYHANVGKAQGSWAKLVRKFCHMFSLLFMLPLCVGTSLVFRKVRGNP